MTVNDLVELLADHRERSPAKGEAEVFVYDEDQKYLSISAVGFDEDHGAQDILLYV